MAALHHLLSHIRSGGTSAALGPSPPTPWTPPLPNTPKAPAPSPSFAFKLLSLLLLMILRSTARWLLAAASPLG